MRIGLGMQSPHTPENWSAAAADYDESVTDFTGLYTADLLQRLEPTPSCRILEVAAGPGNVTEQLAKRCAKVLATDYAPGMIERLRSRMERAGITNVECAVMNGQDLDVEDDSFTRAVSSFGVMLFDDRAAGFSELHRALEPGGIAVVSGWSGPEKMDTFGLFGAAVQKALPDLPQPEKPPAIFSLADRGRFAAEMEAAGFGEVQVDAVTHVLEIPTKEEFWELMHGSAPPAKALFAAIGEDDVERVRDALFALVDARFGGRHLELHHEATIGRGVARA